MTEPVKCPTCSGIQAVEGDAVRYACTLCGSAWTWALCLGCARLELALEGQESWKCSRCSRYTRSWWRSTSADAEARRIAGVRVERRTGGVRAREVAPRRRRRRIAAAVTGTAAVVLSTAALLATASRATPADHDRAACAAFADARSTIANGGMHIEEIVRALDDVRIEAEQGTPAVAEAVGDLVDAGRPGTAAFLVAQTQVVRACA